LPFPKLELIFYLRKINPKETRARDLSEFLFKSLMKFKFLFFGLYLFFSLDSKAADPEFYRLKVTTKRWEYSQRESFLDGKVSRRILQKLDSIYEKYPSGYEFIFDPSSQSLKVFVHCSFDFYSIENEELIKEYQFSNRGYTCGSYLFERNNSYFILGGRGLWNYHADLMQFVASDGSWEFVQTKNQPLDYFQLGSYQTSKGIVTWLGEYNNPRIPKLGDERNGFFFDFEKKSWQPIQIDIKEFDIGEISHNNDSQLFETEDYAFSVTSSQLPSLGWYIWILIEKETGRLFFYEGKKNVEMFHTPYHEVIGNKFQFFDYNTNSATDGKEIEIDLDLIRSQSREIGQINILDAPNTTKNTSILTVLLWVGIPILILLSLWLGIQIQKRKNTAAQSSLNSDTESEGEQESEEENAEILQQLLRHNGKKLSIEEFDAILGIHEITNFDSKRIKRSRLIKSINKHHEEKNGFPLITRIKNSEDKRFIFYRITFENGN